MSEILRRARATGRPPRSASFAKSRPAAWVLAAAIVLAAAPARGEMGTRGTVPHLKNAPTIDGRVEPAEWAGALGYNGAIYPMSVTLFPRDTQFYMGWTEQGVYVACRAPILAGEKPRAEVRKADIEGAEPRAISRMLEKDDSFQLWLTSPDRGPSMYLVVNPDGLSAVLGGKDKADLTTVRTAAASDADQLGYEVMVPWAVLGLGEAVHTQRLRILPVRNYRRGTSIEAFLPFAFRANVGDRRHHPLFDFRYVPAVHMANPAEGLYAGKPQANLTVHNRVGKAAKVSAELTVRKARNVLLNASAEAAIEPGQSARLTLPAEAAEVYDPAEEALYTYSLKVTDADGAVLLETTFNANPATNREWLGDKLPSPGRAKRRVVTVDPHENVPFSFRRFMGRYEDLPEGHKLKIAVIRKVVPGKGFVVDSIQDITPINPAGQKDGVQAFYRLGYLVEHVVTWQNGVRHGPEKFWAPAGRNWYVQKVVPWRHGVVSGTQRVFHPSGKVMIEVEVQDGRPVGQARRYDEQGRLTRITPFKDGKKDGEMVEFFPRRPMTIARMRQGRLHGRLRILTWGQKAKRHVPYRNGVRHGEGAVWQEPGTMLQEPEYWWQGRKVTEQEYEQLTNPDAEPDSKDGAKK